MLKPLFLGLAMTTLVAACTEDYTNWAKPQTHPQEEFKKITVAVDGVNAIDMNVLGEQEKGAKVEVLKATVTGAPRSAVSYKLTLTPAEGLKGDQKPTTLEADSLGKVSVAELEKVVASYYGSAPIQRQLNAKVVSLININDESYRFDAETAVRFTPLMFFSKVMNVQAGGNTVASLISNNFNGNYNGFAGILAPFTLQYVRKSQPVTLNASHFLLLEGNFSQDAQQNITAPQAGFYYLEVNISKDGEYNLKPTAITRVAVVGSLNDWGNNGHTDTPMTYNATEDCWEVTTDLDGGEFKFRFNGGWGINLGGSLEDLVFNSPNNIRAPKGKHLVRLYLNRKDGKPLHATLTAK